MNLLTGLGTLTDRENNEYNVAKFRGEGWWMTQNLAARSRYDDCDGIVPLKLSTANLYDEASYMHPNANASSPLVHGLLYNWTAASNFAGGLSGIEGTIDQGEGNGVANPNPADIQQVGIEGICPKGWHLPSDLEWNRLEKEINDNPTLYATGSEAPAAWNTAYNVQLYDSRGGTSDLMQSKTSLSGTKGRSKPSAEGGFDLLLTGRGSDGLPSVYTLHEYYWTSSTFDSLTAWRRGVTGDSGIIKGMYRNKQDRATLYSVRCKKN